MTEEPQEAYQNQNKCLTYKCKRCNKWRTTIQATTKPRTSRKMKTREQGWSKKEWVKAVMDKDKRRNYYPEMEKEDEDQEQ